MPVIDPKALIREILRERPMASIAELNRELTRRLDAYNHAPQADFGGLSPIAMGQLLYGDWMETGALRVARDLSPVEVADVAVLADVRLLLEFVRDRGPIKLTATGALPLAVVAELVPRLRTELPLPGHDPFEWIGRRLEDDVRWLPVLRFMLTASGLLYRRKGLRVSKRGLAMLADERAGELYSLLFLVLFRELDLRLLDYYEGQAALQSTVAYSFYRLRDCARTWTSHRTLADQAWHPDKRDPPTEFQLERGLDLAPGTFRWRVLEPLLQFGLLEARVPPGPEPDYARDKEFRTTPLFDRFLRFDFTAAPKSRPLGTPRG
jgi:hypothetical protein